MLRAVIGGFLAGPVILIIVALVWSKAALLATSMLVVLGALLVIIVIAGGSFWAQRRSRIAGEANSLPASTRALEPPLNIASSTSPAEPVPASAVGNVTLTSTPTGVRANASENLASTNRWRSAFSGWRYLPPS
jgi:hypothetical protein